MKFGIREVCDCKFTKLSGVGPVEFIIDTAKMSTLDNSSSTVYAQGGQGYSRLLAWEGEKVVTFTVEDALISEDAFWALTGAERELTTNGVKYRVKTTSFAGFYKVEADTLFRELETGKDMPTKIKFPKVKLQTTLNLSMAPTGDPSTFTFTFDAFPEDEELYSLEIITANPAETNQSYTVTLVAGNVATTKTVSDNPTALLEIDINGKITLNETVITTTKAGDILTDGTYTFESKFLTVPGTYYFEAIANPNA